MKSGEALESQNGIIGSRGHNASRNNEWSNHSTARQIRNQLPAAILNGCLKNDQLRSIVDARACVTSNIEGNAIYPGAPARLVRKGITVSRNLTSLSWAEREFPGHGTGDMGRQI